MQQKGKDAATLFQICRSNENNNRSNRWEIVFKKSNVDEVKDRKITFYVLMNYIW
jgi:hypothetical protein